MSPSKRRTVTVPHKPHTDKLHQTPAARNTPRERRQAARAVAGNFAQDALDCALILNVLGLAPEEGL